MSAFTPASEVLLRHSDDFESARVLFAGDLQDDLLMRVWIPRPAAPIPNSSTTGRSSTARWVTPSVLA